jgi:threonine aldolase
MTKPPIVELRSDTFTTPTPEMRRAMAEAEVGDDVWGEDPTAIALQEHCAAIFGKEAGLFVPSGTMGNEASLKAMTRPGDVIIAEATCHLVLYENGAPGVVSGVLIRTVESPDGRLEPARVAELIGAANEHTVRPALVWIENTHNYRGGRVVPLEDLRQVARIARDAGVSVFMDGARIFNAVVAAGVKVADYAAEVDALSFCFSKGLGAPIGSMVVGSAEFIGEVREARQMLGGGMRQVGMLCAAARVAIDTGIERLAEDHANARRLADACAEILPGSVDPSCVETNMVFVDVGPERDVDAIVAAMGADGVLVATARPGVFRAVTHRDVSADGIERAVAAFQRAVTAAA